MNQNDKVRHWGKGHGCLCVYVCVYVGPTIFLKDPLALWAQSFKKCPQEVLA